MTGRADTAAERIVIYRLGSLGDTVVTLPCFHKVAEAFPRAERIVLTNFPVSSAAAPVDAILGGSGLVHATIAYPIGTRAPKALWRLCRRLRALGGSTLIYLTEARGRLTAYRDVAFFRMCGFRRIIGAPLTNDLQRYRTDGESGMDEAECQRLARCLAALGPIDLDDPRLWNLHLTDEERRIGRAVLAPFGSRPFVAIHMGGKVAKNDWGQANWIRLLANLAGDLGDFGLLVVGGAEDSLRARTVAETWPGPSVDACGRLLPRQSAAALEPARLFIGHDSGPLHLASACLCPWVGIFGNNNPPKRWHPRLGQGLVLHRMDGVSAITVQEVTEAVRRVIGR